MKEISLIGNTGFIGKNLIELKYFNFSKFFNSKNIEQITIFDHDLIVCAAPSAEKWKANLEPQQDLDSIKKIINNLDNLDNKTIFFLISTVDVYDLNNDELKEDRIVISNSFYGKHRLLLEDFVKQKFNKYYIIRLPGLFGKHLKKNIIFDLLNNNVKDNTINLFDEYQWFDIGDLKEIFNFVQREKINILNVCSEPISNEEIIKLFNVENLNFLKNKKVSYNIKTIYNKTGYLYKKEYILNKIEEFIRGYRNI